jgi:hypothetical protein
MAAFVLCFCLSGGFVRVDMRSRLLSFEVIARAFFLSPQADVLLMIAEGL